jgi:hypothetical protein
MMTPQLESTTYHYKVEAPDPGSPDGWPDLLKRYSSTLHYRPDVLTFNVHVTQEKHRVIVQSVHLSGRRILKDGLSEHRVQETHLTARERPEFVAKYIERVVAHHTGTPESEERPEHRACRRQS